MKTHLRISPAHKSLILSHLLLFLLLQHFYLQMLSTDVEWRAGFAPKMMNLVTAVWTHTENPNKFFGIVTAAQRSLSELMAPGWFFCLQTTRRPCPCAPCKYITISGKWLMFKRQLPPRDRLFDCGSASLFIRSIRSLFQRGYCQWRRLLFEVVPLMVNHWFLDVVASQNKCVRENAGIFAGSLLLFLQLSLICWFIPPPPILCQARHYWEHSHGEFIITTS